SNLLPYSFLPSVLRPPLLTLFPYTTLFRSLSNVAVLLMYLLCCAACWFLVQRAVRADGHPFNFPGMQIVPALAIIAIIWILAHADRKSTRLNSSHLGISYAVFCLKKKKHIT